MQLLLSLWLLAVRKLLKLRLKKQPWKLRLKKPLRLLKKLLRLQMLLLLMPLLHQLTLQLLKLLRRKKLHRLSNQISPEIRYISVKKEACNLRIARLS